MRIEGRTHHMLVSAWGKRWKEIVLSFFTAYVDDSGSDPRQRVANATVVIIPATRLIALEREWDALKRKEGFSCWHTSEFSARQADTDFADWDDVKHDRVFKRVREICKKYCVQPMSFTVHKADYDEIVPEWFRKSSGVYHYTWAIRQLLSHCVQWRLQHRVPPLEYVFDWMGTKRNNPRRQEIEDVLDQAEEDAIVKGRAGEYVNSSFRSRCEFPGLQCTDALAWCVFQYAMMSFCKKPMVRDAQIAWDDFGTYLSGKWGYNVTITRDNLQKWIDAEIADGRSLQKFEAWRQRKRAQQGVRTVRPHDGRTSKGSPQSCKSQAGSGKSSEKEETES